VVSRAFVGTREGGDLGEGVTKEMFKRLALAASSLLALVLAGGAHFKI
jgi:hypothetical protein